MNREPGFITEADTIHAIVTAHPNLREVLKGLSPRFRKLDNPVFFNTVARTATVKDASKMGRLYLRELLYELNDAIGLGDEFLAREKSRLHAARESFLKSGSQEADGAQSAGNPPSWMADTGGFEEADVRNDTEDPFLRIHRLAQQIPAGGGFVLIQRFVPHPLIGYLHSQGFESWTEQAGDEEYRIYFHKQKEHA